MATLRIRATQDSNQKISGVVHAVQTALAASRPRIVVHGDVILDEYLSGSVERISPEAPIPILVGETQVHRPGGAGNVAANLASLGARVDLSGLIGDDEAGRLLREALGQCDVDASKLVEVKGRRTTRKLRVVAGAQQQIVRIDFEETAPPPADIAARQVATTKRLLEGADALIISDYGKGACPDAALGDLISFARTAGVPVLCDPKGQDYGKYAGASVITPNRKEAAEATGLRLTDPEQVIVAAAGLRQSLGLEACLITLGPQGMLLDHDGETTTIPAFAHDVSDVTGAGDSVIAAFGLGLACGLPYPAAGLFANAVAAISVSKPGSVAVAMGEVVETYIPPANPRAGSAPIARAALADRMREVREAGRSIVFTNGCFDVLHAGHVHSLGRCAELGDFVVVGLNSDASVTRLKGPGRPINRAEDRADVLLALKAVDAVVIFEEDTPEEIIRLVRPDILVKGADYAGKEVVGQTFVESLGGRVELVAFKTGLSTTGIINKLKA